MATPHPVVIGRDFNLVYSPRDKSNMVINNPHLLRMFNDWVVELDLVKLHRWG